MNYDKRVKNFNETHAHVITLENVFVSSNCKKKAWHNEKHDSSYCTNCDTWLEMACTTIVRCRYCQHRPEKPSEVR